MADMTEKRRLIQVTACVFAAATLLAGCYNVDSLQGTQAEQITVDGRKIHGAPRHDRRAQPAPPPGAAGDDGDRPRLRDGIRARPQRGEDHHAAHLQGRPYSQEVEGMEGINYRTTFTCK